MLVLDVKIKGADTLMAALDTMPSALNKAMYDGVKEFSLDVVEPRMRDIPPEGDDQYAGSGLFNVRTGQYVESIKTNMIENNGGVTGIVGPGAASDKGVLYDELLERGTGVYGPYHQVITAWDHKPMPIPLVSGGIMFRYSHEGMRAWHQVQRTYDDTKDKAAPIVEKAVQTMINDTLK